MFLQAIYNLSELRNQTLFKRSNINFSFITQQVRMLYFVSTIVVNLRLINTPAVRNRYLKVIEIACIFIAAESLTQQKAKLHNTLMKSLQRQREQTVQQTSCIKNALNRCVTSIFINRLHNFFLRQQSACCLTQQRHQQHNLAATDRCITNCLQTLSAGSMNFTNEYGGRIANVVKMTQADGSPRALHPYRSRRSFVTMTSLPPNK